MPAISVILPVYNGEKHIGEAVESILQQTFTDFELIIINDASTDGTLEILKRFHDPRIRLITNSTNLKVVKTLNKGLDLASGEFIARMDADDIAHADRFEKQLAYLKSHHEVDFCSTWVKVFGGKNYIIEPYEQHEYLKAALLFLNIIVHPTVMFRKKIMEEYDIRYDDSYINCEDYGLWVKMIDVVRFAVIPEVLLDYRVHDSNASIRRLSNWAVIKAMNCKAYSYLLKKMNVDYTNEELSLHFDIGFSNLTDISNHELLECLAWLSKISRANKTSRFINQNILMNEILLKIGVLVRNTRKNTINYFQVLSAVNKMFSLHNYWFILLFKLKRKFMNFQK